MVALAAPEDQSPPQHLYALEVDHPTPPPISSPPLIICMILLQPRGFLLHLHPPLRSGVNGIQ